MLNRGTIEALRARTHIDKVARMPGAGQAAFKAGFGRFRPTSAITAHRGREHVRVQNASVPKRIGPKCIGAKSVSGGVISRVQSPARGPMDAARGRQSFIWAACCQARSSSQPGSLGAKPACLGLATGTRPLFGLAPGGVYHADPVTRRPGALLPHPFTLACKVSLHRRYTLCGTVPEPPRMAARRAVPATLVSWSPDFPRFPAIASAP